jgi:hypothetical protein
MRDQLQLMADMIVRRHAAQVQPVRVRPVAAAPAPAPAPLPTEADYRAALGAHDWHFEYADDASAWRAGCASLQRIRAMQQALDPERVIWNQYARRSL